jgi:hypothetical protein
VVVIYYDIFLVVGYQLLNPFGIMSLLFLLASVDDVFLDVG